MDELSNNVSFVYIDRNPGIQLISYMNLKKENLTEDYTEEEIMEWELVA